jgi:holliday junction DNA helicase RuvA
MISQLEGKISERGSNYVVLSVGGVGYKIFMPLDTLSSIPAGDQSTKIFTHLAVRENALDLYGFLNKSDLDFFTLLIGVSGIGPKSAQAILNIADASVLRAAIVSSDSSHLTKVSGIGKKNADKIILELKDKLGGETFLGDGTRVRDEADALEALRALGYSLPQARDALRKIPPTVSGTNARLKEALKILNAK